MGDGREPLGHEDVRNFRDFVAEARRLRFPLRRCRAGRRLAPDARAAELCTEDQPCAFHSILAMALSRSFRAGRGEAEREDEATPKPAQATSPAALSPPLEIAEVAKLGREPARDLVLEETADLALAENVRV
jgi:hypothetical protein